MTLLTDARRELHRLGDADAALQMQRYMKSTMPFHGVSTVERRAIGKKLFALLPLATAPEWQRLVLQLWKGARYREERYLALGLCQEKKARSFQTMAALPMYERMIVEGAWWDLVDGLVGRLGEILRTEPRPMKKAMLAFANSDNLWKRRSAILCQLQFKTDFDVDLLHRAILPSIDSKEFFLRKGIGWALRQRARVAPTEVRRFVAKYETRLSGLSKREALKHLG